MKLLNNINKIFLLLILIGNFLFSQENVVAAISQVKGKAMIKVNGTKKYIPVYKGQMLQKGDWLKTGEKVFIAIVFLDGSNIKIKSESEVKIVSYRVTSKALKTTLEIAQGQTYNNVNKQIDGDFTIKTPTAVASVKGTEFDVAFDESDDATTLNVIEGSVEFGDLLGQLLEIGQQQAARVQSDSPPEVIPYVKPDWQENTNPANSISLKSDKSGRQPINKSNKILISILNFNDKSKNNDYNGDLSISSDSESILFSKNNSTWRKSITNSLTNGEGYIYIKSVKSGSANILVSADNMESEKISLNFYESKRQKKGLQSKFVEVLEKSGQSEVVSILNDKSLKSAKIISGVDNSSIDDIIQKIGTNEYKIINVTQQGSDGNIKIKVTAVPREK